ncbi:MAG: Uma2 family endonuclease [Pseudanabaenaceae cyanobacterium SKYGB_i_bin29]|nr:Uma2 family endonuclease [Pseudanabaenaceae cyanobacterium SKYG29]MDW8420811.1 Uma2 family endonuclease [Pseudanabaenaceae cyanobacterium SKYGB_i_bin29]
MIATPKYNFMTAAEYLAWEKLQEIRYEYLEGQVYAMTGGTIPHNDITLNLATALKTFLKGTNCKVQMSDVKVILSEQGPYFYPDVVVSCDEQDRQAKDGIRSPKLIVEVLSPSTLGFDYGHKFRYYRRLPSLLEYVLIDSESINVDCYRRIDRQWQLTNYPESGELLHFVSIDWQYSLSLLYENVKL